MNGPYVLSELQSFGLPDRVNHLSIKKALSPVNFDLRMEPKLFCSPESAEGLVPDGITILDLIKELRYSMTYHTVSHYIFMLVANNL